MEKVEGRFVVRVIMTSYLCIQIVMGGLQLCASGYIFEVDMMT